MTAEHEDYKLILKALGSALVEIRAATSLQMAQDLANVFHNVPGGIAHGTAPEDIRKRLDATALRLGCEKYIDALFASAARNMKAI